ncbi:dTMP kinase [uncultured Mailhella sp.]|uniref:dTMP kinase n=1 Tax=uncultured Mailhella sp. TaxID=1981031 RepID=UPI002618E371|nr:dTMP kinase [uncultured Mailhella sp.]
MFLTVEGGEGAGKSTLIRLLAEALKARGLTCLCTREPGGCPLGLQIRPLLLQRAQTMNNRAELLLFLADRAQHVAEVIRPALERGEWVLCDRYSDSTIAYQGCGRGMDKDALQRLNDWASGGLWPDLTLLLDLPAEEGLARARARNGLTHREESEGRFESEALAFHQRIRQGFLERAARWPERFCILDARRSPEAVLCEALAAIDRLHG